MDAQREMGMVNNRVFEALAVGATLISDYFPALEALCGDKVLYVRSPGDVARHLESILTVSGEAVKGGELGSKTAFAERQSRRLFVEEAHTWSFRLEEMLSFAVSLDDLPLGYREVDSSGEMSENDEEYGRTSMEKENQEMAATAAGPERCSSASKNNCLRLAIVVDPNLAHDISLGSTFVPAVDMLSPVYRVDWWKAPETFENGAAAKPPLRVENIGQSDDHQILGDGMERSRTLPASQEVSYLAGYDVIWAVGRWGGSADKTVRRELSALSRDDRRTTDSLGAQMRGMVLWGRICTPTTGSDRGLTEGDQNRQENECPDFIGREGLRWYDVVYTQTDGDHALLHKAAFGGAVSDNLQVAWGFGLRRSKADSRPTSTEETSGVDQKLLQYDALVVGTDDQIPEMFMLLEKRERVRVALAVLIPPSGLTLAARPALLSLLTAAGVSADLNTTATVYPSDLPATFPLYDGEGERGKRLAPRHADIILVRHAGDALTLAKTASMTDEVFISAEEEQGSWATLVVATGLGNRGQEKLHLLNHEDDRNVQALRDQWPGGWDADFYSRRLIAGTTRALCLGRGNSRITMTRPTEGSSMVVGGTDSFAVEVNIEDFVLGRDGMWCVTAGGYVLLCSLRDQRVFTIKTNSSGMNKINWAPPWGSAELGGVDSGGDSGGVDAHTTNRAFVSIDLRVELRSNMYSDVLYRSEKATLLVDPTHAKLQVSCSNTNQTSSDETVPKEFHARLNVTDFCRPESIVLLSLSEAAAHCGSDAEQSRSSGGGDRLVHAPGLSVSARES